MKKSLVFCLLLVLFCTKENMPKGGVVSVNGKWISQAEIDRVIDMYRQQMMRVMPQQALEAVPPEVKKNVTMQLIASELALQEAKKRGIGCDSAKVEQTFAGIAKQFPNAAAMKSELDKMGQTEATVRGQIRDGLTVDSLMKTLFKKSDTVTADECKAYYDGNLAQFSSEKRVRASQIMLLNKKNSTPEQKKEIADKAKKILDEVRGGKDFAACAKKYSQDPNASAGGDVGWFKKGDIKPEFERVAMGLKNNEISNVFETDAGFHIIKKTGEETLPPKKFNDVADQIKNMLGLRKKNDVVNGFVDSLYRIAKVTFADTSYKPMMEVMAPPMPKGMLKAK
jgi:peptidyl-prolyl cis-trans isomerase C